MDAVVWIILAVTGLLTLIISLLFAFPSFWRYEIRAGLIGLAGAGLGVALVAAALLPWTAKPYMAGLLVILGIGFLLLFHLPLGSVERGNERPSTQFDERAIMFSRIRLIPGTPHYEQYYSEHPEHKEIDDVIRALPGLLSPDTPMADVLSFAAANAAFFHAESIRDAVDGPVAPTPVTINPGTSANYVKNLGRYFGAHKTGITEVKNYHIYSHNGRGSGEYGAPILLNHPYVIVFTFEMAEEMVRTAPKAPEVMETARQYSEAAKSAVQIAAWIRELGYEARAHIDGNYRLILPLVGRDSGLGEIGRMGILMTPDLGPRVRLSAVSTTMPLACDSRGDNKAVLDFCRNCKKCAENCPGQAIPLEERQEIDGALRWKINAEKCFHYWNVVGTDCGRCMMVCPYSHANDPAHNLMRWLVGRSGAVRRLAFHLDNWVYGRKPKTRPGPEWTQYLL